MHGISPRNPSLTPDQHRTSAAISQAIPALPTTLAELISEMAAADYSPALQALELDDAGQVIQSPQNLSTIAHIEWALTATSSECDPKIKASIFYNATGDAILFPGDPGLLCNQRDIHPYLSRIINDLTRRGQPINLDDVVLVDLNLTGNHVGLDLSGMSAKRADFNGINFTAVKLDGAGLNGANLTNCYLSDTSMIGANVTDAVFSKMTFLYSEVNQLIGNQSALLESTRSLYHTDYVPGVTTKITKKLYIDQVDFAAVPDMNSFTLRADEINT